MLDLVFRYKTSLARHNDQDALAAALEFSRKRESVIRSNLICEGCGLRSKPAPPSRPSGYFEVHHRNDDHHDNRTTNYALVCPACHSVFTGGLRGDDFNKKHDSPNVFTVLIYPEMDQKSLIQMVHMVYLAKEGLGFIQNIDSMKQEEREEAWIPKLSDRDRYLENIQKVISLHGGAMEHIEEVGSLRARKAFGTDNPINLRIAIMEIGLQKLGSQQSRILKDVRILHNNHELKDAYSHWFSVINRSMPPHLWFKQASS